MSVETPSIMRAWRVSRHGDPPEAIEIADVPLPDPGPGEALVEVWSTGLGVADVLAVKGPAREEGDDTDVDPGLLVPGLELCGSIATVGEGVDRLRIGERVVGTTLPPYGSLGAYALCRADDLMPAPAHLDDASASVFHVAYQTAWFGLYRRAALHVGEVLLVYDASGEIGIAAVQLGRAAGAHVIGVAGAEAAPLVRKIGADAVIDASMSDIVPAIREASGGRDVDVVIDPDGGQSLAASIAVIGFEGQIVVVGMPGAAVQPMALEDSVRRCYSVLGLQWDTYRRQSPSLLQRAHEDLNRLVGAGAVRPLITSRLAYGDAGKGLAQLAAGGVVGRIVVAPA